MKALMAVTTANQLKYTKLFLQSYNDANPKNVDLLIVDDSSEDGTVDFCRSNGIEVISKPKPKGLTHSWNLAYQKFKNENYEYLILSNNDILVPKNALEELISGVKNNLMSGPLCNSKGVPFNAEQEVKRYLPMTEDDNDPSNFQDIQNKLEKSSGGFVTVERLNGFIFCLNREIVNYEYSSTELFDPRNKNIANEDELCDRLQGGKVICKTSFFFHFKGVSFKSFSMQDGNYQLERNLTWKQASKLKSNRGVFVLYRVWRKLKESLGLGRKS